jgi:UDP-N-acetylmuramoyl-L-alanyl-D-glutamate--2,6-diaminopimelate ligase
MTGVPRPNPREIALHEVLSVLAGSDVRLHGDSSACITGIELDSRLIRPGDLFAALPGHVGHGIAFAQSAVSRGAVAILTDSIGRQALNPSVSGMLPVIEVTSPRQWLGAISTYVYGNAAADVSIFGVTGTNGKTTVAYMLEAGLREAGHTTGIIGTIGIRIGDAEVTASRTTPEAPHLHALLGAMKEAGVDAVAVEVSSHAIQEGRVDAVRFQVAGFTNLSQDHLDYHGTMDAYFASKAALFTSERCVQAVIGIDDEWGRRLAAESTVPLVTWSMSTADSRADWTLQRRDEHWEVHGPGGEVQALQMPLPGDFNRANALCAYAMLRQGGVPAESAASGIAKVRVPGRMERVPAGLALGEVIGIVDYAHSPDAIEQAIHSVREQSPGRVIVVIGAGGDRDRAKRPLMGAGAARLADVVIVTDDNPRTEDPAAIRAEVLEGAMSVMSAGHVEHVPDRRAAIDFAVACAGPGDTVLVLGKGHEQGQEIAGVTTPFDDRIELGRALEARHAASGGIR